MKSYFFFSVMVFILVLSCKDNTPTKTTDLKLNTSNEIHFFTSDSVKVYGDIFVQDNSSPIIILLHQAGTNSRAEYKNIIPQLHERGFSTLAIDQRVGSSHFYGGTNRTAGELPINQYNYCEAYPDLVAALNYIEKSDLKRKVVLWGSSYSASLAIQLAKNNQDQVNGVLAFSPASGGPMEACKPEVYFETLKLPLLLVRPFSEMQSRTSQSQFDLAKLSGHETYIAQNGVHGSSLLDASRVEGSVVDNWKVVTDFLNQFK